MPRGYGCRCGWRRVRAWVLWFLALTLWFLFSAFVLYGFVPGSLVEEALRGLRGLSSRGSVASLAWGIFTNNLRVLLVFCVPLLGHIVGFFALTLTAAVGRAAAEAIAAVTGAHSWVMVFVRYIVATPFFPLEMLAYAVAAAESFELAVGHRSVRRCLTGLLAAVVLLAAAAAVEAMTIHVFVR